MTKIVSNHGVNFEVKFDLPQNAENSAQFMLVALLAGTISVQVKSFYKTQSTNFTAIPSLSQKKRGVNALNRVFTSYDIGGGLPVFIASTLADNRSFYQELLAEFSQYFVQSKRGAHAAAFIFLYRVMERLFYSVPLLYVSTTKDYIGTFNELKALLIDEKSGEQGFFKKFLNQGRFIDKNILDQVYILNLTASDGDEGRLPDVLKKIFKSFVPAGPSLDQIGCKFRDVPELLVQVRNRFFHSRTGDEKPNITLKSIGDPDFFFEKLNPVFCNVLGVIAMHSLAKKYGKAA